MLSRTSSPPPKGILNPPLDVLLLFKKVVSSTSTALCELLKLNVMVSPK